MSGPEDTNTPKDVKTSKHAGRYLIVGITVTLFNFVLYTVIARIFNNNDLLWLSTLIATFITTFVAYGLHSRITWKERNPGKLGIYKFFIWNLLAALAIGPFFTWVFSLMTPLYEFAFNISSAIHLPFDYDFVQSTGAFVLTSIVTMILNFLFYDKFVFGKKTKGQQKYVELLKQNYQRTIAYGLISIGAVLIISILIFFRQHILFCWHGLFLIIVGVTILPLAKKEK